MNPFLWLYKQIASLFGFLWYILKDLTADIVFLGVLFKKISKNQPIVNKDKWEAYQKEMKSMTIGDWLKGSWYWILVVIFGIMAGYIVGLAYAQMKCNNFIMQEFGPKVVHNLSQQFINISRFIK